MAIKAIPARKRTRLALGARRLVAFIGNNVRLEYVNRARVSPELLTLSQQAIQANFYHLFRLGSHAVNDFAGGFKNSKDWVERDRT